MRVNDDLHANDSWQSVGSDCKWRDEEDEPKNYQKRAKSKTLKRRRFAIKAT